MKNISKVIPSKPLRFATRSSGPPTGFAGGPLPLIAEGGEGFEDITLEKSYNYDY